MLSKNLVLEFLDVALDLHCGAIWSQSAQARSGGGVTTLKSIHNAVRTSTAFNFHTHVLVVFPPPHLEASFFFDP